MDLKAKALSSQENCIDFILPTGYSLRINAFYAWVEKSNSNIREVGKLLGLTEYELVQKLEAREVFGKEEITKLVKKMGAKDAFFVIHYPSFQFRRYVYRQVFGKPMKYERRCKNE